MSAKHRYTKVEFEGQITAVKARIRLLRSFDQIHHSCLGYVLVLGGTLDGAPARDCGSRSGRRPMRSTSSASATRSPGRRWLYPSRRPSRPVGTMSVNCGFSAGDQQSKTCPVALENSQCLSPLRSRPRHGNAQGLAKPSHPVQFSTVRMAITTLTTLSFFLALLLLPFRSRLSLQLEVLALRHQLTVYQRAKAKPRLTPADRVLWAWLSRVWADWRQALLSSSPPRSSSGSGRGSETTGRG